ncbi:MAG: AAA family ATPase [Desertifilum sp. SIO1I2]|nr:AAA family ATPase [Desertifilum sp. SIO1I2]
MTPPIVKRYFIALSQYWFAIPIGMLLGGTGGFVFSEMPVAPPSYRIDGVLQYTRPPVSFSQTGTAIQTQGQSLTKDLLLAPNVIQAVANRPEVQEDIRTIRSKANVRLPNRESRRREEAETELFATVQYQTGDPNQGLVIVDALMQEMVEQSRLLNTARLRSIIDEINKRLPEVTTELRQAEQQLQQFIREEQTAILATQTGQLPAAITGTQNQQRQIRLAIEGIEAQMRSLQERLGLSPDQAYASAALSADPIIGDLRAQIYRNESQMQFLSQSLRPDHPNMVELNQQQQMLTQMLQQRASEVIGGGGLAAPLRSGDQIRQDSSLDPARQQLAQNLVALQTQRDSLQQQLQASLVTEEELKRQYAALPNKQMEQARLEQQVALKKTFYDTMQAKLIDAQAAEAETASSLTLAQAPRVASEEIAQPLPAPILLAAGTGGGFVAGAAVVFLLGMLAGTLQTMEDIRSALRDREVNILGILPFIDAFDPEVDGEPIIASLHSPYLESYERFRSNLRSIEGKAVKVVLMTSTIAEEGKTVSAYNLAIAAARAGKRTLLVEADLRSHSLARAVKVAPDPASTLEPFMYYGQLSECIRLVPNVENLYVVPSLGPHRQAAALLESAEMRQLLEDARGRFDFVVVDSPALSLCNDALLLEPLTDGIVLVTRPCFTADSMLAESVDQLTESEEFRLLGAIINGADIPVKRLPLVEPPMATVESVEPPKAPTQSRQSEKQKAKTR